MGAAGDCFDNAMCGSLFATLECELLDRFGFGAGRARNGGVRFHREVVQPSRRHPGIGYRSPLQFGNRNRWTTHKPSTIH